MSHTVATFLEALLLFFQPAGSSCTVAYFGSSHCIAYNTTFITVADSTTFIQVPSRDKKTSNKTRYRRKSSAKPKKKKRKKRNRRKNLRKNEKKITGTVLVYRHSRGIYAPVPVLFCTVPQHSHLPNEGCVQGTTSPKTWRQGNPRRLCP